MALVQLIFCFLWTSVIVVDAQFIDNEFVLFSGCVSSATEEAEQEVSTWEELSEVSNCFLQISRKYDCVDVEDQVVQVHPFLGKMANNCTHGSEIGLCDLFPESMTALCPISCLNLNLEEEPEEPGETDSDSASFLEGLELEGFKNIFKILTLIFSSLAISKTSYDFVQEQLEPDDKNIRDIEKLARESDSFENSTASLAKVMDEILNRKEEKYRKIVKRKLAARRRGFDERDNQNNQNDDDDDDDPFGPLFSQARRERGNAKTFSRLMESANKRPEKKEARKRSIQPISNEKFLSLLGKSKKNQSSDQDKDQERGKAVTKNRFNPRERHQTQTKTSSASSSKNSGDSQEKKQKFYRKVRRKKAKDDDYDWKWNFWGDGNGGDGHNYNEKVDDQEYKRHFGEDEQFYFREGDEALPSQRFEDVEEKLENVTNTETRNSAGRQRQFDFQFPSMETKANSPRSRGSPGSAGYINQRWPEHEQKSEASRRRSPNSPPSKRDFKK